MPNKILFSGNARKRLLYIFSGNAIKRLFYILIPIIIIILWVCWPLSIFLSRNCAETIETTFNLSGIDFEVTSVVCFNPSVNVFASKAGTNLKVLLFEYDPILLDDNGHYVTPSIKISDKNITFHIERVAQVLTHEDKWNDYNIMYQIDYIPDLSRPGFGNQGLRR